MISWHLEIVDELPSTSNECISRAREGKPEGYAVMALRQSAGRGSRGRDWYAPAGNLNLSLLLRPSSLATDAGTFALLTGVAVAEALQSLTQCKVTLKWPNDVLLGYGKLAGILIDIAFCDTLIEWLVIGIGINLRSAPQIEGTRTVSLTEYGIDLAPETLARTILGRLDHWLPASRAAVIDAWLSWGHATGTRVTIRSCSRVLIGDFAGLSPRGELLLRLPDHIEVINTGEVLLDLP